MKKYSPEKIWVKTWVFFIFSLGPIHLLSKIISFDPFILERTASLALAILMLGLLIHTGRLKTSKSQTLQTLSIILLAAISILTAKEGKPAPPVFFIFVLIVAISNQSTKSKNTAAVLFKECRNLRKALIAIYAFLAIALASNSEIFFSLGNRFTGGFSSPTTFATWLTAIHLIAYSDSFARPSKTKKYHGVPATLILMFFVLNSGTRINLILLLAILLIFTKKDLLLRKKFRTLVISGALTTTLLIYPLYEIATNFIPTEFIAARYESGVDASFGLRQTLFNRIYENYTSSSLTSIITGLGGESSSILIENEWGTNLLPHNDTIRITHDYGIIFLLIFANLIITMGRKSAPAAALTTLYIFSFIHNMIYSHYLLVAIILLSNYQPNENDQHNKETNAQPNPNPTKKRDIYFPKSI